jgi:hypothetical protein
VNSIALLLLGPIAGLAADAAGTLAIADHSEADLRRVIPGQQIVIPGQPIVGSPPSPHSTAIDLQTAPAATLQLTWPEVSFGLGYGLNIAAIDITNPNRSEAAKKPVLTQSGNLSVGWAPTADLQFTLAAGGSYGKKSYVGLTPTLDLTPKPAGGTGGTAPPAPPPTQGPVVSYVPLTEEILTVGAGRVSLGMSYRFDATTTGTASAFYEISGGINTAETPRSEVLLPRQHAPGVNLGLTYALDANNSLISTATATDVRVVTIGSEYQILTLSETWAHKFDAQTNGTVGLGIVSQHYKPFPNWTWGTSTLPNATANIAHTIPLDAWSALILTGGSGIGTGYNAVTGQILYGVTAAASATWKYDTFGSTATMTYGQNLHLRETDPDTTQSFGAGLAFTYTPVALIDIQAGARSSWQVVPGQVDSPFLWVLFAGIGLRAPPLTF